MGDLIVYRQVAKRLMFGSRLDLRPEFGRESMGTSISRVSSTGLSQLQRVNSLRIQIQSDLSRSLAMYRARVLVPRRFHRLLALYLMSDRMSALTPGATSQLCVTTIAYRSRILGNLLPTAV
jgi:hypothetical protein